MAKVKTSVLQYKLVKAIIEPGNKNINKHTYFIAINEINPKQETVFLLPDNFLLNLKKLGWKENKKDNIFILLGKGLYCYLLIRDCLKNKVKPIQDYFSDKFNFGLNINKEKHIKKLTRLIFKRRLSYNDILVALLFGAKEDNSLYIIPADTKTVWTAKDLELLDFALLKGFEFKRQLLSFGEKKIKQAINK